MRAEIEPKPTDRRSSHRAGGCHSGSDCLPHPRGPQ